MCKCWIVRTIQKLLETKLASHRLKNRCFYLMRYLQVTCPKGQWPHMIFKQLYKSISSFWCVEMISLLPRKEVNPTVFAHNIPNTICHSHLWCFNICYFLFILTEYLRKWCLWFILNTLAFFCGCPIDGLMMSYHQYMLQQTQISSGTFVAIAQSSHLDVPVDLWVVGGLL